MQTQRHNRATRTSERAFTLTELLVIVCVIGLLVLLHAPAVTGTRTRSKVAQCSSNLKQYTMAVHIYANEYRDRLPYFSSTTGFWAWDVPRETGTFVEGTGCDWRVMFCPGTAPRFTDQDNFALYNYSPAFRVLGYASTFPGTFSVTQSERNWTLSPTPAQTGFATFRTPLTSERVLLADAMISTPFGLTNRNNPSLDFSNIFGGFQKAHTSPHLNGRLPIGCNVSMLDGHVEWRGFDQMAPRTEPNAGGPTFWW